MRLVSETRVNPAGASAVVVQRFADICRRPSPLWLRSARTLLPAFSQPGAKVKISPLVTLGVVAVLGVGILLVNVSQESESATPADPWAKATTTAATLPGQASTAAPTAAVEQFPAKADYVAKITTANPVITLEITVEGDKAIAYACDGNTIEAWLRGSAQNGVLNLESKDKKSRLDGPLQGSTDAGTLASNQKK